MLVHVATFGRSRPNVLRPDADIVTPTRGRVGLALKERRKCNIELRDVSKENGLWGHQDWPEAVEMNDAGAGVFSLSWMDIEKDGAPDLFVKWHGRGALVLKNDGRGSFTLHKTNLCPEAAAAQTALAACEAVHTYLDCRRPPALMLASRTRANSIGTPSLIGCSDCIARNGTKLPANHSCHLTGPFTAGTSSLGCVPQYFDGHGAIAVDLNNNGHQDVFVAVGGAQGQLTCSGPDIKDCRYPGMSRRDSIARYDTALKRSGNSIYITVGDKLVGGQRGSRHMRIEGLGQRSHVVTAADFNGDGLLDLFVGNWADKAFPLGTHPSRIWLQQRNCDKNLAEGYEEYEEFFASESCFGDADQLGYVDPHVDPAYRKDCETLGSDSCGILRNVQVINNNTHTGGFTHVLQHEAGLLSLQRWDGHRLSLTATKLFRQPPLKACPILIGDFNGDGGTLEALSCKGFSRRQELVLHRSLDAMFADDGVAEPLQRIRALTQKGSITPIAAADLDNDGDLDALAVEDWVDKTGAPQARLRVLENDGAGRLAMSRLAGQGHISLGPPTDTMVVGFVGVVADVDSDGRMDVALNDAGSRVMLFKNTSPRRPWICITPEGTHSNRAGIGALIRISQGTRVIRRDVTSSSPAQDFDRASCTGLFEDGPANVEICWPRPLLSDHSSLRARPGYGECEQFGALENNRTHVLREVVPLPR